MADDHDVEVEVNVAELIAIGGRIGMRNAARQLLKALDELSPEELQAAGYTLDEITMLERIALWKIDGLP